MQHPNTERLAELIDGTPTLFEREHLASCQSCMQELEAYGRLVRLAADERRHIAPALSSWDGIRAGLDAEGLIAPTVTSPRAIRRRWMQQGAAAVAFLAVGAAVGRVSAGPTAHAVDGSLAVASGEPSTSFRSANDALQQLQQAQRAYDEAWNWLAVNDTTAASRAPDQYRTRLAALDMASETFEDALSNAPEDPIINQYYLSTMNARESTIRRLGTALPVSVRMGRF